MAQQFETAQFLPVAVRRRLGGELVCYARFVVKEWPRLASATDETVDTANPWTVALLRTLKVTNPRSVTEQASYDKWLDRTADREGQLVRFAGDQAAGQGTAFPAVLRNSHRDMQKSPAPKKSDNGFGGGGRLPPVLCGGGPGGRDR